MALLVDTHILGWFAKQAGLFSECVDPAIVRATNRKIDTLCRGVGIDDESDQVP